MKVINYFKGFLNPKDDTKSSKTLVGLGAFTYLLVAGFCDLLLKKVPTEFVFYGMIGIVIGCFGLNTYITQKAMSVKGSVASDMVTNDPDEKSMEGAKETLKADKP